MVFFFGYNLLPGRSGKDTFLSILLMVIVQRFTDVERAGCKGNVMNDGVADDAERKIIERYKRFSG
jgi:hypothetical protein